MIDYNLDGLSPDSFEHLVQALFLKVVSPGGIVFGSGPDGAREATFDGRMDYPSQSEPWSGYLVVQAKFLEYPSGDVKKDGEWLLARLREELAKFKNPKRDLRQPTYYLFCSNVRLTSVWKTGTKDLIYAEFKGAGLDLKDYRIWDYDQVNRFLDDAPGIAQNYGCWIQPGYVLTKAIEWIGDLHADFEKAIANYLQKELVRDHYLRLDQSGVTGGVDPRIPVERVFIDLAASERELVDPPEEEAGEHVLPPGFVKRLLTACAGKCDFESIRRRRQTEQDPCTGRMVLIGGPGQGKTTISQYVCQLHRAAILRDRQHMAEHVTSVVDAVTAQSAQEGIPVPAARRYPVRIELSEFAKAIAEKSGNRPGSLLAFIAQRIRSISDHPVELNSVRKWLSKYPWLLILDGLDEVPGSANRLEVVKMVNDLLIDIVDENGDVFVMVTSRRQGYKNDFPQEHFRHWYLTPLSTARALHCAERFARVHMGDVDREKVMAQLAAAAQTEATARLMRSPLQVTIMATLAQSSSIPDDRWRLFSEYYRIIYEREVSKRTWNVLESNREDIHAIHNRVALLLQIECERTGQTDARLTTVRFQEIVRGRLMEQTPAGDDLNRLTNEIVNAASERLVFLVGVEADRVGFEIRSIQEFMAARALLHGREQAVIERLQHIAPIPHWRNTFVFAAANCFSEREWLGDTITGICARLNEPANEPIAARALAGSQLALELVEAGVAIRQPKFRGVLNGFALEILDRAPCEAQERLAAVNDSESSLLNRIAAALQPDGPVHLGAWNALLSLIRRGVLDAETLGDAAWPKTRAQQAILLSLRERMEALDWLLNKAIAFVVESPFASDLGPVLRVFDEIYEESDVAIIGGRGQHGLLEIKSRAPEGISLSVTPRTSDSWRRMDPSVVSHGASSRFVAAVRQFASDPTQEHLARCLTAAAPLFPFTRLHLLPWPIALALSTCNDDADVRERAEAALRGDLGSAVHWEAAEARWSRGFDREDLTAFGDHEGSLGTYLVECGVPLTAATIFSRYSRDADPLTDALTGLISRVHNKSLKKEAARLAGFLLSNSRVPVPLNELLLILNEKEHLWLDWDFASLVPVQEDRVKLYEHTFVDDRPWIFYSGVPEIDITTLVSQASEDNTRLSLLPALRHLTSSPVTLPRQIVLGSNPETKAQKTACAVLAAGQEYFHPDDAALIIRTLYDSDGDTSPLRDALRLARAGAAVQSIAALAMGTLDHLRASEWATAAEAYDTLDDILRRRRTEFLSLPSTRVEPWLVQNLSSSL